MFLSISISLSLFINKNNYIEKVNSPITLVFCIFLRYLISFGLILGYFGIEYKFKNEDKENFDKFNELIYNNNTQNNNINNKVNHSFCSFDIYNIPIYLYQTFINDAFYYDEQSKNSSFQFTNYSKFFFDEKYKIDIKGNLTNEKGVKMIQYNIQNNKNNVTVLSIKGTSIQKDIYLDGQLFLPSLLLTLLNTFSNIDQQKETYILNFMQYGLSIPYRINFQFYTIQKYLDQLTTAYNKRFSNSKENIVIVGHSLGGGLAKLLGRLVGKKAISLSGPGINAFHSLLNATGNKNFELTSVDIIPDLDLVPRVEVSVGTIYRILCLKSPIDCHSKELSLCESMIICGNPNYFEYCYNIAKLLPWEIEQYKNNISFNNL